MAGGDAHSSHSFADLAPSSAAQPAASPVLFPRSGSGEGGTAAEVLQRIAYKQESVKVNYEGTEVEVDRTTQVEGDIKVTKTSGRPPAPNPYPYRQIEKACKLSKGSLITNTPYDKGHVMALELGGEDVEQNIVPQWGNWQRTGAWRRKEVAAKKKGKKYKVDVTYGDRSLKLAPLVPASFDVWIDGKKSELENEPDQLDLNEAPKLEARHEFELDFIRKILADKKKGIDLSSEKYEDEMVKEVVEKYPTYMRPPKKLLKEMQEKATEEEKELKHPEGSLTEYFVGKAGLKPGLKGKKTKKVERGKKIFGELLKRSEGYEEEDLDLSGSELEDLESSGDKKRKLDVLEEKVKKVKFGELEDFPEEDPEDSEYVEGGELDDL